MEKQKYVVCDLDGTLCDHRHRIHLAWLGKWDEYNGACKFDGLIRETSEFIYQLHDVEGFDIVFLTGRSIKFIAETTKWIDRNNIAGYKLIMRQDNDFRKASEFKEAELTQFLLDNEIDIEQVEYAIDDDADCCEMLKELGIKKVIQYGK
jgi:hydroxymethylpyrimidine pyrophosphatase-like HAD family hydrolase